MKTKRKKMKLFGALLCSFILAGSMPVAALADDTAEGAAEKIAVVSSESAKVSTSDVSDVSVKEESKVTAASSEDVNTSSEDASVPVKAVSKAHAEDADKSTDDVTAAPSEAASAPSEAAAPSVAAKAPAKSTAVAWIGETGYATLEEAVNAAKSGDTIKLGAGKYTLYKKGANTKDKDLTFVGQGTDKTEWGIGAKMPDPNNFGTEYNGDYSFDGAGTITFKNMTMQSGSADYLGFIRANNTVLEDCVLNGKTFYWGYKSAVFKNTTFNAPSGDYSLWTYSSPEMTFDNCTFNSSGKTINVYTDYGAGKNDITINFNNCTVNNSGFTNKSVLNINDSNMGGFKYIINITGNNTINNTIFDVYRDKVTCCRLFGFGGKARTNNTGRSVVSIGGETVFKDGKMVGHEIDTADGKYTNGYNDDAYTVTKGDWTKADDEDKHIRSVKKVCDYCGNINEYNEEGYTVTYSDGTDNEEVFADQMTIVPAGDKTPAFDGEEPSREGHDFKGWDSDIADTVNGNIVYTAVWEKKAAPVEPKPTVPEKKPEGDNKPGTVTKPDNTTNTCAPAKPGKVVKADNVTSPKTGDTSNSVMWLAVMLIGGSAAVAATIVKKNKR